MEVQGLDVQGLGPISSQRPSLLPAHKFANRFLEGEATKDPGQSDISQYPKTLNHKISNTVIFILFY